MRKLTKCGIFLGLLCLLGALTPLLFWDLGEECLSILGTGAGDGTYLLVSADADGNIHALSRENGSYHLVIGDHAGNRIALWTLDGNAFPKQTRPALLYPMADGTVYFGLYNMTEEIVQLQLYRLTQHGGAAELLLSEDCVGGTLAEQIGSVRLSNFAAGLDNGVVTFAVLQDTTAQVYRADNAKPGLEAVGTLDQQGLVSAVSLYDGTMVFATSDSLMSIDRELATLEEGQTIIQMNEAGTGIYYLDGASLNVYYLDHEMRPDLYKVLDRSAYDLDSCTSLYLTQDGDALMLMDHQRLMLDHNGTVSDLSEMLYRPAWQCVLILAGLALGVLFLTALLWYLVCEQNKLRIPMLLRWGMPVVAIVLLSTGWFLRLDMEPAYRTTAQREAENLLDSITTLQLQSMDFTDPQLTRQLNDSIASAADGTYRDTKVDIYHSHNGIWTLSSGNAGIPAGIRAELVSSFDWNRAEQALEDGQVFWIKQDADEIHYVLYHAKGNDVLCVDVNGAQLLQEEQAGYNWMIKGFWSLAVLFAALILAVLCWITISVRRIMGGMERLAAGERDINVRVGGGDELASMSDRVSAMSVAMGKLERQRSELVTAYRRFVPERVLSLLGKEDIAEVDQTTFVTRRLAAMMLSFEFPEQVYSSSGKDLFDHINEVIGRTAPIVAQKGGTVFNLTYNGYDAVFEGGSAVAVSTAVAVQQEVLEINRERERRGAPQVSVRIALDEGNVMLGVVGDGNHLEPTSISLSFSVVRHLIELCGKLEANILCTETVMAGIKGYSSRYMGKCSQGDTYIRTYEIFDGDPYEKRKVKEQTVQRFSDGVYALYSRDFSQAKRIFLGLVHSSTADGGAKYYLYLADQLEKRQSGEISLDSIV